MENSIKEIKKLFRTHESLSSSAINDIWKEVKREGYEYVDLSYNETAIEEIIIPSDIPSVKYLYLYKSKIKKITLNGSLPNLEILHVGENELKEFTLPSGFPKLEHLRLDKNQLETFEIMNPAALKNMQSLFLQKNKITNIEASFWDVNGNCWDNVKTVLKAIDISGAIINNEAKVIWFGNGMAGKTTLSKQIRNKIFPDIKEKDRTHGILIKDWKIPYQKDAPDFKELTQVIHQEIKEEKEKKPDIEIPLPENIILSMWDFGGQEYYHATHRLFLNNNVMYLLVWDEDTETQNEEKGIYPRSYWKDNIWYYADKEKVILEIQNKARTRLDVNHENNQYKVGFRNKQNSQGEKDVRSIQEYEWDVKDLEKGIMSRLHQLGFLGRIFPKAYDDIRIALREHKSKYLSYTTYRQFCQENDPTRDTEALMIDEKQVENLTTFLDNTGAIICYRNKANCPKGLEDLVFLDSAWVTGMIYEILNKELILKGEFDIQHVAKQTQGSGLSAEQWINLMKQFKLIFEINKEEDEILKTYYVAPQYLPKKCLNIAAKKMTLKGKKMLPAFSLHFPKFLSKSIFLEFLANFGSASEMYLYWKTGIIFFVSDVLVLADCDYKNKKINFQIQNGNRNVLNELFHWFEKEEKINDDTEVKLNENDGFINIKKLKDNLGNNIQKFIHKDCTISCEAYEVLFTGRMGEEGMEIEKLGGRGIGFNKPSSPPIQIKRHPNPPAKVKQREGDKIVLVLAANPKSTKHLELNKELKKIKKSKKKGKDRKDYEIEMALEASIDDLREEVTNESPTILHFSGHGSKNGELIFEGENGEMEIASVAAISEFFEIFKDEIQCVILNACYSEDQGNAIAQHIPVVIGMKRAIPDVAAIQFSEAFYDSIFSGRDYIQSFKLGRNAIKLKDLAEDLIPVLFVDGMVV